MGITSRRGTIRTRFIQLAEKPATSKVRRISLADKTEGHGRKCQTLRGPAVVDLGQDIRLLVLSGEAEIVWDAPKTVFIGDVEAVEIVK